MKTIFKTVMILLTLSIFILSCDIRTIESADTIEQQQTTQKLKEASREVGMPSIINYQEKKTYKWILELRDTENLITFTYLFNEREGKIGQFLGKSIGYGIPAATQYTNPNKVIDPDRLAGQSYGQGEGTPVILPQADPNGLFMPTTTSATWVLLLDKKGKPHPLYIEPLIIVSPIKLH